MKLVQKGNRQLRVADNRLEEMRKSGYVEVDAKTGKPVAVPAADDGTAALKREVSALKRENKELKATVEALKTENGNLKEQIEGLTVQLSALSQGPGESGIL